MTTMDINSESAPALWATQGGGYASLTADDVYVWHELPEWMVELPDGDPDKAAIGDPIHPEWGLAPVNDRAMDVMDPPYEGESDI